MMLQCAKGNASVASLMDLIVRACSFKNVTCHHYSENTTVKMNVAEIRDPERALGKEVTLSDIIIIAL